MFFQRIRQVAFFFAMLPNANNALALFGRIFDFPVHPIAVLGLGRDVANKHPSPIDGRRKDLRLDVVLISGIVELADVDGGVPNFHPFRRQQIFELLKPMIVLMDMAYEYVPFVCHLSPPWFRLFVRS